MTSALRVGLVLACALGVFGCGGGDDEPRVAPPPPPQRPLFEYDRSAPLVFADRGRVNRASPISVRDVSYVAAGRRVRAFLVVPPGRGPYPAVVYAHGSGEDRLAFVGVAAWLVARGAVAITVDQPSTGGGEGAGDVLSALRRERARTSRSVVELRRAIDVLASLRQVDARRIGFVGFSAGARFGAILAGLERRVDAFVLMSGGASPVAEYVRPLQPGLRAQASALLQDIDPLRYVRRAAPAALLIQDGKRDEVVPRAALVALARAASEPKRVRWYDAGHGLNVSAFRDQLDWLTRELRITGPRARGASTGP